MSKNAEDWHLLTQNDDYLRVSLERLRQPRLIWVDQVCEIIHETLRY